MKLHLGCGTKRLPGYTHIDSRPEVGPDIVANVADLHMIDNNSVDLIYACHVLEHVSRMAAPGVLREWRRVLKSGGELRLSVPNFEMVVDLYRNGTVLMRLWGLLHGGQTYPGNTHYACYDYQSLAYLLGDAGFHSIDLWIPIFPEGYDDYSMAQIDGKFVSLNVEALAK